jgi:hypothetical protein
MALAMAIFFFGPLVSHMSNDELRWACFLWTTREWQYLQTLKRIDLIVMFDLLKNAKPMPPMREEVTLHPVFGGPIVMILGEVGIGDRKLNMLIAMCERKNKARFVTSDVAKLAHGVYNVVGSQILRIREPGGGA